MNWYTLRVISGKESKIRENLLYELDMQNLSNEVAKYNIRINTISPGNVMFKGSTWDKKYKVNKNAIQKYIKNNVPLNCFIKPNDISQAVIFLENSKHITGTNIIIDGGQTRKII